MDAGCEGTKVSGVDADCIKLNKKFSLYIIFIASHFTFDTGALYLPSDLARQQMIGWLKLIC